MAEIPVAKAPRSPMPWWAWLVAALAAAGLVAMLVGRDREPPAAEPPAPVVERSPAPATAPDPQPSADGGVDAGSSADGSAAGSDRPVDPDATHSRDGAVH